MTKKRSTSLFVIFAIILVICLFATFFNFTYPFSIKGNYYSYSSFVNSMSLGEDISSSVRLVYNAKVHDNTDSANYNELKLSTMQQLRSILQSEGYKDTTVSEYGENSIALQVGNIYGKDDYNAVVSLVGNPATIHFSMSSNVDEAFAGAKDIKEVSTFSQVDEEGVTNYYVLIEFENKDKLSTATKDAGTLYIFFGETQRFSLPLSSAIENGYISISSDDFKDQVVANTYANQIKTGMLDLALTQIEVGVMQPTYGAHSSVLLWVVLGLIVLASFVYLILKYKHLGWLACFNLLFFICIGLFLLQSIPLTHFNFAGMIGLALGFILATDSLITIIERAKKYYNADTKFYIALKLAQKESLFKILISNALVFVVGLICVFMPNMAVQSFGWVALVLPFVSLFSSLALMRLFINMYLPFNNTDGKKCNFHKGGKNA